MTPINRAFAAKQAPAAGAETPGRGGFLGDLVARGPWKLAANPVR